MTPVRVIVTVPPHATFLEEVARHPIVGGLRLNTVMPIQGGHAAVLARLAGLGKTLYVDLKGRQLRVVEAAVPPFTAVRVSHRVHVRTPVDAWFDAGRERARVLAVDGDRLILEAGPQRVVGPGESVNIVSPTLEIEGTLTAGDLAYVEAARGLGLHDYMLSYVEREEDVAEVRALDPKARVVLKLESVRGLHLARARGASLGRLMAARGDLFVEVLRPHRVLAALREVIAADPEAIAASRILTSLGYGEVPDESDITDVGYLLALGYRTLMLGDEVCLKRDTVLSALNVIEAIAADWPEAHR